MTTSLIVIIPGGCGGTYGTATVTCAKPRSGSRSNSKANSFVGLLDQPGGYRSAKWPERLSNAAAPSRPAATPEGAVFFVAQVRTDNNMSVAVQMNSAAKRIGAPFRSSRPGEG